MKLTLNHKIKCILDDCENHFKPKNRTHKTCSPECSTKYWRIKKGARQEPLANQCALPGCTEIIDRTTRHRGRPQLYCCTEHRKQHSYAENFGMTDKELTARCANEFCFNTPIFVKTHGLQKFCCDECRTFANNRKKIIAEEERNMMQRRYDCRCHYCGTNFKGARATTQFCTKSCANMFSRSYRVTDQVYFDLHQRRGGYKDIDRAGDIFIDCKFEGWDFAGSYFTKTRFIRCSFEDCDFSLSVFDDSYFEDCKWAGDNVFEKAGFYKPLPPFDTNHCDLKSVIILSAEKASKTAARHKDSLIAKRRRLNAKV